MRYLPDGRWMQEADRHTIEEIGIPSVVLMEHAAGKTVEVLQQEEIDCSEALIVCGSGNNGGDGFAIARLLHGQKCRVTVLFAGRESSMSNECRIQAVIVKNLGIPVVTKLPEKEYTVIVDAIFGVGLNRTVGGHYHELIERLNQMKGKKVAVDIPSGISSADGRVLGIAFSAGLTVAFQCEKLGCVLFPGKEYAGKVVSVDIGVDMSFMKRKRNLCYTLDKDDIPLMLPERKANSHKGSYGRVLMITGSEGMAGAAYLSAKAAYTSGAGLVRIYTPESNCGILQQLLPEAIVTAYSQYNESELESLLEWADVVCIGCGLGQNALSAEILKTVFRKCKSPCVADADGINLLSGCPELLREAKMPVVLTPHMKEMADLLGCSVSELIEERMEKLSRFTEIYPAVCVLKDARTVVTDRSGSRFVNTAGNHAMAKAGSGDVLAGVITGLIAGGLHIYDGAVLGVYLHACGGDVARDRLGSYSVLAEDLIKGIGICMKEAEENRG